MIVTFPAETPDHAVEGIISEAGRLHIGCRMLRFADGSVVVGFEKSMPPDSLEGLLAASVLPSHRPYMLVSKEHRERSIVRVGDVEIGSGDPVLIAGPCVVESREQMIEAALAVRQAGARILRGGAFKPRTSPYSFQGHGEPGLRMLADARLTTGLPVVTEVLEPEQVELVAGYADMLQIGARNMANTPLLKKAARAGKPILLKRGFSATIEEWMMSAEYILSEGNPDVVLCERGIRGFDPAVRFNLDLTAVPLAQQLTHLPVIVDPSHGTGLRSLVQPMAYAAIAAGASGLIIEAQPDPDLAVCDGYQTISTSELTLLNRKVARLHAALSADDQASNAEIGNAVLAHS
ncbi:MAG: 3-deoxy-7-phosphoheptulonate synthase [Thermomicrobiales bacterium]